MSNATIIGEVAVKVRPDTDGFRGEVKRELTAVEKMLKDLEVGFRIDVSEVARQTESALAEARRVADRSEIQFRFDAESVDELSNSLKRVEKGIDGLKKRTTINVDLNEHDLLAQRAALEAMLERQIKLEVELDNHAWNDVQAQVHNLLRDVKIEPSLDTNVVARLRDDLAKNLEKIGTLRKELELDLSDREKHRVEREIDDLEGKIEVTLGELSVRTTQGRLALLARGRIAEISPAIDEAAAAKVAATLSALSSFRAFKNIGDDFADWIGHLDESVPRIATASLAISNLSSLALSGTSNVAAFGGSLATTAGAALALPGILGGMAIGLGASIAVLKDFNKVLPNVATRLHGLQDSMSESFWAKAKAPIEGFIDDLFPEFQANIENTSTMLGQFFGNLANSATGEFGGELQSMFDDLNDSIRIAGLYSDNFLSIIHQLGEVGAGNLPRLARWFGDISDQFDGWLQAKGTNGLQDFVDTGIDALQDLGGILQNTGSILRGLYDAAESAGGSTLAVVRQTTKDIADTVNGKSFQDALRSAFHGAHEGIDELTSTAGPAFESLTERIAYMLNSVLPTAGRTAGKALKGIFDALDSPTVEKSVVGLFENLETVVDNLTPSLPAVGDALAGVTDVVGDLAVNLSRALGPALDTVAPAITGLADDLDPLVTALGDLLVNAVEIASPLVDDLAGSIGVLAGDVAAVLRPINELIDLFQQLPGPVTAVIGHLASLGLLVGGTMWLGTMVRAKVAGFGSSLVQAGNEATVTQGAFLRAGAAANGLAGRMTTGRLAVLGAGGAIAGLGGQLGGTNKAVGILSSAVGGATMGATFGPWGAVIGGAAGALVGFAQNTGKSKKEMEEAAAAGAAYADTLNRITGASTEATRALAYDNLVKGNAFKIASDYGLSARTIVNAVTGEANARRQLSAVIATANAEGDAYAAKAQSLYRQYGDTMTKAQGDEYEMYKKLGEQHHAAADDLGKETGEVDRTTVAMRRKILAITDYRSMFRGDQIPKAVITRFETAGIPSSTAAMARLADKFHLMPKQVRTIIQESGADFTWKQVKRVLDKLHEADKTRANPKVQIDTLPAEKRVKDTTNQVKNLDKVTGAAKVKVDDKATQPIVDVRKRLTDYARVVVTATVRINDLASEQIEHIQTKLDNLKDRTVSVTTVQRSVAGSSKSGKSGDPSSRFAANASSVAIKSYLSFDLDDSLKAGIKAAQAASKGVQNGFQQQSNKIQNTFDAILRTATAKSRKALRAEYLDNIRSFETDRKQLDKVLKNLADAQQNLANLREQLKTFRAGIVDSFNAIGDPVSIGAKTYAGIVRGMNQAAEHAQRFDDAIQKLIQAGLNPTTLQQLLAAGPEAGLAQAEAIVSGGVDQINAAQQKILDAAKNTSKAAGNYVFGDLVGEANKDVNELIKQVKQLEKPLRAAAKTLIDALRDELKKQLKAAQAEQQAKNKSKTKTSSKTKKTSAAPRMAAVPSSVTDTPNGATVNNRTLIYNAAPGKSLTCEEDLYDAIGKAQGGW